jgi:hypothetical protein
MLSYLRRAFAVSLAAWPIMCAPALSAERELAARKPFRILHIMSYHSPWRWTDGQLAGFKDGLGDLWVEFKVFEMDTKRHSSRAAVEKKAREAIQLIETWKPDLVYATDDDAQEHVTKRYVNKDLPFVFSGVNKDSATHGFTGSRNITGVLEQEHFVESLKLLQTLAPGVRKIAVVLDGAPMWDPVVRRIRERTKMRATTKGTPVISLARANRLGLKVKSRVLLSAEVINRFDWDPR